MVDRRGKGDDDVDLAVEYQDRDLLGTTHRRATGHGTRADEIVMLAAA